MTGRLLSGLHRAAAVVVLSAALAAPAAAQQPTVQQVYDKFAEAVGGRAAWAKVVDRTETGKADIAYVGISGTYARYYGGGGKYRLVIDLGMGKVEQGSDGSVVWSGQPDGSVAKMPEPDATYSIEANQSGDAFLNMTAYTKADVVGQEEFDGVPCYKLQVTTKAGRERVEYFEVATGLRRGQVFQNAGGQQRTVWRDYKEFEGKKVATKTVLTNAQGDIVLTVDAVSFAPTDAALYALPAGIAK